MKKLILIFLILNVIIIIKCFTNNNNSREKNNEEWKRKEIRSMSSIIYKIFLNEFHKHNQHYYNFSCSSITTKHSNSIRILNANKIFKISYLSDENKVLFKVLANSKRRNATVNKLVKLHKHENLVKIELFLINKYNLRIHVSLCNNQESRRRCKTLTKSNKNYLIRLNITNRQMNSYLVMQMPSTAARLNKETFEKSFSYVLIANLHDRVKCEFEKKHRQKQVKSNRFVRSIRNDDEEEDEDENEQQCKRVIQRVDFDKIFGSNNLIIQPSNYIAYKCEGGCDFKYGKFSTNHSTIQSLYNWLKPNSIKRPCCVPIKYKPLYLLNYDANNEIVMKQHENMVVDTCGCV